MKMPDRLEMLRQFLQTGSASTQEDLRDGLARKGIEVNQSTVSRDLRRLGAIRIVDVSGRITYRLQDELSDPPPALSGEFSALVRSIQSNGSMIIIRTSPGSASLVARHLDQMPPSMILGTIAGDDTIFVAPASIKKADVAMGYIRSSLGIFEN